MPTKRDSTAGRILTALLIVAIVFGPGCFSSDLLARMASCVGLPPPQTGDEAFWVILMFFLFGGSNPDYPPDGPFLGPRFQGAAVPSGMVVLRTAAGGSALENRFFNSPLRSGGVVLSPLGDARLRLAGSGFAGRRAYFTDTPADSVVAYDLDSGTEIARVKVGKDPLGIAITPDGRFLFVANRSSGSVSVVRTDTLEVEQSIRASGPAVKPTAVAVTPDGSRAYVVNGDNSGTVSVIDVAARAIVETIRVGRRPTSIVVSPDGLLAYVANNGSNTVVTIDLLTNTVISALPVDRPWGLAASPDGNLVFVTSASTKGKVIAIDTLDNRALFEWEVGDTPIGLACSPDGRQLAVANSNSDFITIISPVTNRVLAEIPARKGLGYIVGIQPAPPR